MLKNLSYLAAFTTFVVLVWVALSIYNNVHSSTISHTESVQIEPLTPTFNTTVLDALKTRQQISVDLSENMTASTASAKTILQPQSPESFINTPSPTPTPPSNVSPTQIPVTPTQPVISPAISITPSL